LASAVTLKMPKETAPWSTAETSAVSSGEVCGSRSAVTAAVSLVTEIVATMELKRFDPVACANASEARCWVTEVVLPFDAPASAWEVARWVREAGWAPRCCSDEVWVRPLQYNDHFASPRPWMVIGLVATWNMTEPSPLVWGMHSLDEALPSLSFLGGGKMAHVPRGEIAHVPRPWKKSQSCPAGESKIIIKAHRLINHTQSIHAW